jgi:TPR repeat protein
MYVGMENLENEIKAFKSGNYIESIKLLNPLAEEENAEAQCILGNIYHMGLGVNIDGPKAVHWYQQSARQGYAIASNNLAGIYFMGECGVAEDYEEALEWCQLGQKQGFEDSKYIENFIKAKLNSDDIDHIED